MAKTKKQESVIKSSINPQDRSIADQFKAGDFGECIAVGIVKTPGGKYISYKLKFTGETIQDLVLEEPMSRFEATDVAKIDFVKSFMDEE